MLEDRDAEHLASIRGDEATKQADAILRRSGRYSSEDVWRDANVRRSLECGRLFGEEPEVVDVKVVQIVTHPPTYTHTYEAGDSNGPNGGPCEFLIETYGNSWLTEEELQTECQPGLRRSHRVSCLPLTDPDLRWRSNLR